ncbi:MAG TPA: fructosamine kinase family protein [Gammaproteobacteria bacterium]|nr:fructosamine kinase family protein [Gammaproteobacteria bacterium]
MSAQLRSSIEEIVGQPLRTMEPLSGGCVGEVYCVQLRDGTRLVAKVDNRNGAQLACEGRMLGYLRQHTTLPVPTVVHCSDSLLLMEFLDGESRFPPPAQRHAAELLAALHDISADSFGFDYDTLIGGLYQPNPQTSSWLAFFGEQRLLYMGRQAVQSGRMSSQMLGRLEKFTERLSDWLEEPERPSLIHGDVWTTNVLAQGGRITGFIDPAIYFAHAEIELAFTTLFGTFDTAFFKRYHELRPIAPDFMEVRRDIYNLYPLLVHVRLFGGGYVQSVDKTLGRLGY